MVARLNSGPLEEHSAFHHLSSPFLLFSVLSTYISRTENRYHCDISHMCVRDLNRSYHPILCYPSLPPPAPMFFFSLIYFYIFFFLLLFSKFGRRETTCILSVSSAFLL